MTGCKKIDMDTWARREHYEYYTKQLKVEYNITANVDVKNVLDFCHSKGYKFYPAMIYLVTKTLNRIDNFKMFKDKNGKIASNHIASDVDHMKKLYMEHMVSIFTGKAKSAESLHNICLTFIILWTKKKKRKDFGLLYSRQNHVVVADLRLKK